MIGNDLVFLCRWRESNPGRCGFRLTKAKAPQAGQIRMKKPGVSEFLCKRFGLQLMEMRSPN